jgi:hypothetical protein
METLPDDLYDAICMDIADGDNAMKEESCDVALSFYQQALEKIPEPKQDWEISLHAIYRTGRCILQSERL